jgi:hypothetical protein
MQTCYCKQRLLITFCFVVGESLHSLQQAGGVYSLATAPKDLDVRGSLRGYQEGDCLRVLRPKDEQEVGICDIDVSLPLPEKRVPRYPGYALKLTWDVPLRKTQGILKVNACWHDIVFRNECGFAEMNFTF